MKTYKEQVLDQFTNFIDQVMTAEERGVIDVEVDVLANNPEDIMIPWDNLCDWIRELGYTVDLDCSYSWGNIVDIHIYYGLDFIGEICSTHAYGDQYFVRNDIEY